MNKRVFFGIVVLLVVIIVAGVYYYSNLTGFSVKNSNSGTLAQMDGNSNIITISAEKFDYVPSTIIVKKGERVRIAVDNVDTKHGIAIPDLKVSGIDSVEFTADTAGTYEFHCPTFCGSGHREMKGTLIVEE